MEDCNNRIIVITTNSEWKEINSTINGDLIDIFRENYDTSFDDYSKEITFITSWEPTPLLEGEVNRLSSMYPSVLFHYLVETSSGRTKRSEWIANGQNGSETKGIHFRKEAYKLEALRFLSTTNSKAAGINHLVEIMPNGRVASDGENLFGECNTFIWRNIKKVSCGNWHTVGLTKDGTLVACGSNTNKQCEISEITERVADISCGRYHTAILLDDGKVKILGNLEYEAQYPKIIIEHILSADDFPLEVPLSLLSSVSDNKDLDLMNQRIERISVGDKLNLKEGNVYGRDWIVVYNKFDEKIGYITYWEAHKLAKLLKNLQATVTSVTPLSQRSKRAQVARMSIRLDYHVNGKIIEKKKTNETVHYKKYNDWPPVVKIKSIFDAVIGITSDGQMYIHGFCPCSELELKKYMSLID